MAKSKGPGSRDRAVCVCTPPHPPGWMGRGAFFEMASHISDVRPLPGDYDVKMRERSVALSGGTECCFDPRNAGPEENVTSHLLRPGELETKHKHNGSHPCHYCPHFTWGKGSPT
jgi:hypothetical protein